MGQLIEFAKRNKNERFNVKYKGKRCEYCYDCSKILIFKCAEELVLGLNGASILIKTAEIKQISSNEQTATIFLTGDEKIFLKRC